MSKHRERFELAREQFGKALERLREAEQADESAIVRDALIQRFEFTYELAWKAMFYWIRDQGEAVAEFVGPVLQTAFRAQLIGDAQLWGQIKDCRNETSHTYNEAKAIEVAAFVRSHALAAFAALRDKLAVL